MLAPLQLAPLVLTCGTQQHAPRGCARSCLCSDLRGAGTDADVHVVVYGELGDTGERLLDNSLQNNFERGKVGWCASVRAREQRESMTRP